MKPEQGLLSLRGVSENNLKNLSLDIEHNQFVAITGVSGSGKSTLAFDTIYAEGGRRYIETFSPYTRQFLDRLHKPALDSIKGVRPALALEQANRTVNSRSTVGTITEINEYLKLLWARAASIFCPNCSAEVLKDSPHTIIEDCHTRTGKVLILAPIKVAGAASLSAFKETLLSGGLLRYYRDGTISPIEELSEKEYTTGHLAIVLERIKLPLTTKSKRRLIEASTHAFEVAHGVCEVVFLDEKQSKRYTKSLRCSQCDTDFGSPRSSLFSFNSPLGACPQCNGFGKTLAIDQGLIVPDHTLSIADGAVSCWTTQATTWERKELERFCQEKEIDIDTPWNKLSAQQHNLIMNGDDEYYGVLGWFEWLERKKYKMHVRVFLARYRTQKECEDCQGTRIRQEAQVYRVEGRTLPQVWKTPFSELLELFSELSKKHKDDLELSIVLQELHGRLHYLNEVGLGYLTLDRQTRTLSGGEFQRVNLTSILGSQLSNTTLVLDEPTIGLHSRDTHKLIGVIHELKKRGNSLLVVEHDEAVIREADEIIDIGPDSGKQGGDVVFRGHFSDLVKSKSSHTARYLSSPPPRPKSSKTFGDFLKIQGAKEHNLKNIDVRIPLNAFSVLTGVSGSGKSTLIGPCLFDPYNKIKSGQKLNKQDPLKKLVGFSKVDDIVCIDQSAVGKTPRSNPATYTKIWEHIRDCLASTPEAEQLGLSRSAFSFNVEGGRCPDCKGSGSHRVEMQFLADVFVECERCGGTRFQEQVLGVHYQGKSVLDFLRMPLEECAHFFEAVHEDKRALEIRRKIKPLIDLGLEYLSLGHPLNKLSGGEAQRLKLASYLGGAALGPTLFILDEPTTGLHPHNISALLNTFQALIAGGHTVLCIEHNLDVIAQADWLIDLGPDGGEGGGQLIAEGRPLELAKTKTPSETLKYLRSHLRKAKTVTKMSSARSLPTQKASIDITGARHHNLKNISVSIPQNKLVVITGVSGSGKSSLAFDILFAEGQRRYIDCLSPYARQFIKQLERADVDQVTSLPPTVAISQKTSPPLGVSTIATTTEIYQYLRLLYCKVGTQFCPEHDREISEFSSDSITEAILEQCAGKQVYLFAPAVSGRKGYYNDLFNRALKADITEARVDGKMLPLTTDLRLERHKLHWIALLVGSIKVTKKNASLIRDAVEQCLLLGSGVIEISQGSPTAEPVILSRERSCPECKRGFRELDPQDFSFRSKRGVCEECSGRGVIFNGNTSSSCPRCNGARIGPIGRHVLLGGKRIHELTALQPLKLDQFLKKLRLPKRLDPVVLPILEELQARLSMLQEVGLEYLSLDRDSSSISGGEAQRLRLARTLGSPLTGVCYVLDEPTIGLHAEDHKLVMDILGKLRNRGNTVVVVEHDENTIKAADHVIDIGPGGGTQGGNLVAEGTVEELMQTEHSQTGQALKDRKVARCSSGRKSTEMIVLEGAQANNLRSVTASFPLKQLTVCCGVSGSGKSSLIHETLAPAVIHSLEGGDIEHKTWSKIRGLDSVQRYIEIDQTPIGKTSSSTPASYLGIFNDIRKVYALTTEAQARGWTARHFSFNTGDGRCPTCEGKGFLSVPMSFLPEAQTTCEDCRGLRYNEETLEVEFRGHSLGHLMQCTLAEAREVFANHKKIKRVLDYVIELGLGYLSLGQPSHTLSGGEAQRLKIAKELGAREAVDTLYILDEPTTGLHMVDVERLIQVLHKLIDRGNTVVVIEHDLDFLRAADYLIELGPKPGEQGGEVIYQGPPSGIRKTPTARALR